MFRIARVRIRWINSNPVLPTGLGEASDRISLHRAWGLDPRLLRIRLRWVGFGSTNTATQSLERKAISSVLSSAFLILDPRKFQVRIRWVGSGAVDTALYSASASVNTGKKIIVQPGQAVGRVETPAMQPRVSGPGSINRRNTWILGLLAILLGLWAFTRITNTNATNVRNQPVETATALPADLIADDINMGNETIRMIHSPLDIGQSKDVFDGNLETLMRGKAANPFILDLQFPQPEAIKGFTMDFGRMDFILRVSVYAPDNAVPVSYQDEYRQQPDIPHVYINFSDGPKQVRRIYIEIEQINPPEAVHIHVREIVFIR